MLMRVRKNPRKDQVRKKKPTCTCENGKYVGSIIFVVQKLCLTKL